MIKSVAFAAFLVVLSLCACNKSDNTLPSGIGADGGTSGPPGTFLNSALTVGGGDSTWTEIHLNSDHSVAKVITINLGLGGTLGDTAYTTIIPVYASGKLSALQSPSDSLAASGPVTTLFDYTTAGVLERIRYNPGGPGYTYDSLIMGTNGLLAQSFHFVTNSTTGEPTQLYSEAFTWTNKMDIDQILITNIDTSNGSVSSLMASYTYDGFFNPYKTVKDLPFMLGPLDNVLPMISANNTTSAQLVGYNSSNNYIYQYTTKSLPSSQNIQLLQAGALKQSSFVYFQYIAQN